MLQKNIILIFSFIILSFIISLFPPYSWGDEKLRTQNERQRVSYYYENKIPFKQYDFLFNDIKKEFPIGKNKVVLERHLILSELIIQLFLAFLLSILVQFLYKKYSHKFLFILLPILTIIIGVIFILSSFNFFASWFQPDYSIVKNERENIRRIYSSYLENYSLNEIISILNEIDKGYYNSWSYSTKNFWNRNKYSILLSKSNLPDINSYLIKKVERKSKWNFDFSDLYKDDIEKEFPIYKGYQPPSSYKVDYNSLASDIDLIRYKIFTQSKSAIPKYLEIKKQYFNNFTSYWNDKVPTFKNYTLAIFVFIVLILFILYRKPIQQKLKNV